jgi:hypothetical protein
MSASSVHAEHFVTPLEEKTAARMTSRARAREVAWIDLLVPAGMRPCAASQRY